MTPVSTPTPSVDAHLHLWDLDVSDYAWLTPEHGELRATFTADTARAELDAAGIELAVLVQAEDSERDTEFLLGVASDHPWVVGVVGWVQLDHPGLTARQLDRWQQHPALCGVRHLVHNDPRDDFLAIPRVRRSLAMLAERGLSFDVPDAWPRHLAATTALAAALPELRIVLDHLGKPPRGRDDYDQWRQELGALARCPNTVAKFSGLQMPGEPFTVAALRPVWETALHLFGPARLMYGGDWPLTLREGRYSSMWHVVSELISELTLPEQTRVLSGTAGAVYGHRTITRQR